MGSYLIHPITRKPFGERRAANAAVLGVGQLALVATSTGAVTLYAPPGPADASVFAVADVDGQAATNPITVNGNGNTIDGAAQVTLSTAGALAVFVWDTTFGQWKRTVPQRLFQDQEPSLEFSTELGAASGGGGPDFGSQTIKTTGKVEAGYFGPAGTLPASGLWRIPFSASLQSILRGFWSAGNELPIIGQQGGVTKIGDVSLAVINLDAFTLTLWGGAGGFNIVAGGGGGANVLRSDGQTLRTVLPIAGSSPDSMPLRFKRATIAVTGNVTASAAQAECCFLTLTGSPAGSFDLILPNVDQATFNIKNATTQNCTAKRSGGSGVLIGVGSSPWVQHNGTDYEERTA